MNNKATYGTQLFLSSPGSLVGVQGRWREKRTLEPQILSSPGSIAGNLGRCASQLSETVICNYHHNPALLDALRCRLTRPPCMKLLNTIFRFWKNGNYPYIMLAFMSRSVRLALLRGAGRGTRFFYFACLIYAPSILNGTARLADKHSLPLVCASRFSSHILDGTARPSGPCRTGLRLLCLRPWKRIPHRLMTAALYLVRFIKAARSGKAVGPRMLSMHVYLAKCSGRGIAVARVSSRA